MKKVIDTLLRNGYSTTKKYGSTDLPFFLRGICKNGENGGIVCNKNPFWEALNNENRIRLMHDMRGYSNDIRKGTTFHIINEYENGDAYGIVKEWKE